MSSEIKLSTRLSQPVKPTTLDETNRTVDFVAATEAPARVFDWERGGVVEEILLMDGVILPANRQVPLLDSHDRNSVGSVLGSMRDFRIQAGEIVGKAYFGKRQAAFDAYLDVVGGHVTDVSVGYNPRESIWINEGESYAHKGRTYAGPVKLTTSWELKEVSLTPIGADVGAKVRSEAPAAAPVATQTPPEPDRREAGNTSKEKTTVEKTEVTTPITPPAPAPVDTEANQRAAVEAAVKAVAKRAADILETCRAAGVESIAADLIATNASESAVFAAIRAAIPKKQPTPVVIQGGATSDEKTRAAAVDGLLTRYGHAPKTPAAGHEDFNKPMIRIGEELLRSAGVNTSRMDSMQIAGMLLGKRGAYPIASTTLDFTHILGGVQNKAMQRGFTEEPAIWRMIASVNSVPDFKTFSRPQLSEAADLDLINEAGEYVEMKFSDTAESYSIAPYGRKFSVTRRALINDDASAFTGIPARLGAAAQRKINQLVLGILTTNANMHDGNALFSAAHSNYTSGGDTHIDHDGVLAGCRAAMRIQKGFGEDTAILDIVPRYLLVPAALETTALVLLAATTSYGGANPLSTYGITVLPCGLLDATSTKAFFLLASPTQVDTLEVAFLNGVQSPVIEEVDQMDVDGRIYKVRLDVGAKALDWRGMYMSKGEA